MAQLLPPPPINDKPGSFTWLEWYRQLRSYVTTTGNVPWYILDFSGSNITDIALRGHNNLQSIQGGGSNEHYHLTLAEHTALGVPPDHNDTTSKQGGTTNEYYHLTSAEYTALGTPPAHNNTTSKQGGTTNEYYHLTAAEYAALIPDAPSDGHTYGRKNGAWVVLP